MPDPGYRPIPVPGTTSPLSFLQPLSIPEDVPTRQTSSSGRPKSPRIQVVLPEELCARLAALAEAESRTLSNMAKVLIQQGVDRLERQLAPQVAAAGSGLAAPAAPATDIRAVLEQQQRQESRPLRRGPRRLRLLRPPL